MKDLNESYHKLEQIKMLLDNDFNKIDQNMNMNCLNAMVARIKT